MVVLKWLTLPYNRPLPVSISVASLSLSLSQFSHGFAFTVVDISKVPVTRPFLQLWVWSLSLKYTRTLTSQFRTFPMACSGPNPVPTPGPAWRSGTTCWTSPWSLPTERSMGRSSRAPIVSIRWVFFWKLCFFAKLEEIFIVAGFWLLGFNLISFSLFAEKLLEVLRIVSCCLWLSVRIFYTLWMVLGSFKLDYTCATI